MATPYTGNPAGVQAPDVAPAWGVMPVFNLPQDGVDQIDASTWLQALKDGADHLAFIYKNLAGFLGVTTWQSTITYTQGMLTTDVTDSYNTYRVKVGHTSTVGTKPSSDGSNWEKWGHSYTDIAALLPTTAATASVTGVSANNGATLGTILQTQMGSSAIFREVMGRVTIPLTAGSGVTVITLSAGAAMPSAIYYESANYADLSPSTTLVTIKSLGANASQIIVSNAGAGSTCVVSFRLAGY